ncbi:MAG: hypothetical protein J6M10_01070 [Clostridia bacterium]|nr:hypothetical protein [Clostridia bacterium]
MTDRLIGANAAMEKIEELKKFTLSEREEELLDLAAEAVNDLAAMIPETECAPQGRWILCQDAGQGVRWHECSRCCTVGSPAWKRCPLCEAKMKPDGGGKR